MPQIKLIVTDLDGHLPKTNTSFAKKNAQAVRMAQQSGIHVCACTARNWALAKGQVRRAGLERYTVTCNGASIVVNQTGLPVVRTRLAPEDVEGLLNLGVKHNACVAVYTNEQILFLDGYAAQHYESFPSHWATVDRNLAIPVTRCHGILEMVILGAESAELVEFIHPDGVQMNGQERAFLQRFSVSGLGGHCIFIMQHGVSKLSGIQQLAEITKVPRENIMAIGDNDNDADMLRWAGVGVAVGDGNDAAKAVADYITKPHDRGGFYHAVMDIALTGRPIKRCGDGI